MAASTLPLDQRYCQISRQAGRDAALAAALAILSVAYRRDAAPVYDARRTFAALWHWHDGLSFEMDLKLAYARPPVESQPVA